MVPCTAATSHSQLFQKVGAAFLTSAGISPLHTPSDPPCERICAAPDICQQQERFSGMLHRTPKELGSSLRPFQRLQQGKFMVVFSGKGSQRYIYIFLKLFLLRITKRLRHHPDPSSGASDTKCCPGPSSLAQLTATGPHHKASRMQPSPLSDGNLLQPAAPQEAEQPWAQRSFL